MARDDEVQCILCGFTMRELPSRDMTAAKMREHTVERHPGVIERELELIAEFQAGKLTAREMRETLLREFGINDEGI